MKTIYTLTYIDPEDNYLETYSFNAENEALKFALDKFELKSSVISRLVKSGYTSWPNPSKDHDDCLMFLTQTELNPEKRNV